MKKLFPNLFSSASRIDNSTLNKIQYKVIAIIMIFAAILLLNINIVLAQCTHTLELRDAYGDGWNGGMVSLYVGGSLVGTYTLATGAGPAYYDFTANTGQAIQITYNAGSWPEENYYSVKGGDGVYLVTDWFPNTSGTWNGTGVCPTGCLNPNSFLPSAANSSNVNLNFTTNANGNNVVIVYNYTGTFSTPSGTPPSIGGSLASGTLVYNGTISPQTHSGLSANTTYYYKAFSYDGSSYSTGISANTTTLCVNSSLPLSQGFNSSTIPGCWTSQFVSGTSAIQYVTSSSYPTTTPQEGTNYVYWNSYNYSTGNSTRLVSPPITTAGISSVSVNFYWMHDPGYSGNADGVYVEYSTDGIAWTTVGSMIPRYNATLSGWNQKIVTLPAGAGNQATIYVGFRFYSAYGNNCSIDNVLIQETPANPIFSINPSSNAFGNVSVGGSSVQTFTISNAGGSTLTINSSDFTLTGADQTQFQIFGASTLNLTSGQSATIGVQFVPTTPGSKSANLHIVDNIPSAHDIALTGSGVLNAPQTLIGGLNSSFKPSLSWQTPLTGEVKIDDGTVEQNMYVSDPTTTNDLFYNKLVAPHNGTISQIGIYAYAGAANQFNSVMMCPDDGTGKPNLASPYATFSNVAVGVSYSWIFLTLPAPQSVTAGQTFYIVTQWPAGSSTGPYIGADNTIPNGRSYWTQDGGTTWNAWAANWLMRAYMGTYSGKLISGCTPGEMKLLKPTSANDLKKKTDISVRKRIEKPISVPAALIYGANGDKVLSNYTVKRGITSGTYTQDFTGISALTYTDNSAVLGNTYYYVVDAVYTEGTSSHSNEVIVTALNPNYGTFVLNGAGDFYKFSNNTNNGNPGGNEKPTYEWYPTTDFTPITFADNDDGNTQVSFPGQFFRFFDTDYSSVYVNVNGYLTFGGGATDWSPAGPLPQAGDPANMIAAAFRDLYVRTSFSPASNVSYKIFTDKIVISYENIYHISASDGQNYISFQIILIASSSTPSINSLYVINYNDEMSYAPLNTNTIVVDASIGANGPSGSYGYNYRYAGVKGPMFSGVTLGPNGANSLSLGFVDFNAPLPVTLSSFSSSLKGRDVKLTWTTEKEINNSGFDVERKTDANSLWSKVGYVKGSGSTNLPVNYTFEDKKLNSGKYNYRLKQIDYNGNFEYHNLTSLVDVSLPTKFNLSQNYPNPFNPITKIDFDLPFDSKVNIILFDMTGREVKTLINESRTAGFHTVAFNASDLSSGMYFYRIITKSSGKDFVATKKMMLIK